jgi:hypothetical protein
MPRLWLSGTRIFGIRPGISFALSELTRSRPSPRWQLRQLSGAFIYIIQADNGLVKVGVSTNPSVRLAQLQRASAAHLSLAYVGALRCNGFAVEAAAHRTLADYRFEGEWFNCPPDMAVAAIAAAAYRLGEPIASGDPRLADEAIRIAAATNDMARPGLLASIVLAVVKGVIAIPLTLVIWFCFYLIATTI